MPVCPGDMERRQLICEQIRRIEQARVKRLEQAPDTGPNVMVHLLARVTGIGIETRRVVRSGSSARDAASAVSTCRRWMVIAILWKDAKRSSRLFVRDASRRTKLGRLGAWSRVMLAIYSSPSSINVCRPSKKV